MPFLGSPSPWKWSGIQGEPGLVVDTLLILLLTIPIPYPVGLVGSRKAPSSSSFSVQMPTGVPRPPERGREVPPPAPGPSTLERSQGFTGGLATLVALPESSDFKLLILKQLLQWLEKEE